MKPMPSIHWPDTIFVGQINDHEKHKNTPQIVARQAVRKAVRQGVLPKPSTVQCQSEACLNTANGYHHYKGYAKENWLDVEAMCQKCHGKTHRET